MIFFQKFAEIFANECLSMTLDIIAISCTALSTTLAKTLFSMSLTPAINLCPGFSVITGVLDSSGTGDNFSPVIRRRTPWRLRDARDRIKLKGTNRPYLQLSMLDMALDGVIGTAMKSCIHKNPTHLDQRPMRLVKLNYVVLVWSSFGGLRDH